MTVASIAKVREDKSIMESNLSEPEQPKNEKEEGVISKGLDELIERAVEDAEERDKTEE